MSSNSSMPVLHLRSEDKPLEHRSALTPTTAKALIDAGYTVNVERSPVRIFDDAEFEKVGATLVPTATWRDAPKSHIIIGLKELNEDTFPLEHVHIQFAHVYKGQIGWPAVLSRFPRGGGTLLDLEFLQDHTGRRVAAFGYHAGFSGCALALKTWAWQLTHPGTPLPSVESYPNVDTLVVDIKKDLAEGQAKSGNLPRVIVIGALGRCGRGAVDMAIQAGVPESQVLKWDMAETAKGGPFREICESDIFVNCIYLSSSEVPNFVNLESLKAPGRKLSVLADVSADVTNPNNPIPVYTVATTFENPTVPVDGLDNPPLSVISIDHLPSLLPRESSEAFSGDLLPHLLKLNEWQNNPVWSGAKKIFEQKVASLPKETLET